MTGLTPIGVIRDQVFATINLNWNGPKEWPMNMIDAPIAFKRRWYEHVMDTAPEIESTYRLIGMDEHAAVTKDVISHARTYLTNGERYKNLHPRTPPRPRRAEYGYDPGAW